MSIQEISSFSSKDWKIYRYILKHPDISMHTLIKKFGNSAKNRVIDLLHSGLIDFNGWTESEKRVVFQEGEEPMVLMEPKAEYHITQNSLRHYEDYKWLCKRNGIQFWLPISISAAISLGALIVSIVALLK